MLGGTAVLAAVAAVTLPAPGVSTSLATVRELAGGSKLWTSLAACYFTRSFVSFKANFEATITHIRTTNT